MVREAKKAGLGAIALSDHDTVDGVKEAMEEGKRIGVEVVPAIEFSVQSATETHILAYYLDIDSPLLKETLDKVNETRNFSLHLDKMQVSDERKTAAVFNELHRLLRREILNIGIGVFAVFKIELEALLDARGVALVDKKPCEMRPADYAMKPHISIGTGLGNLRIPYSVLENIKKAKESRA